MLSLLYLYKRQKKERQHRVIFARGLGMQSAAYRIAGLPKTKPGGEPGLYSAKRVRHISDCMFFEGFLHLTLQLVHKLVNLAVV